MTKKIFNTFLITVLATVTASAALPQKSSPTLPAVTDQKNYPKNADTHQDKKSFKKHLESQFEKIERLTKELSISKSYLKAKSDEVEKITKTLSTSNAALQIKSDEIEQLKRKLADLTLNLKSAGQDLSTCVNEKDLIQKRFTKGKTTKQTSDEMSKFIVTCDIAQAFAQLAQQKALIENGKRSPTDILVDNELFWEYLSQFNEMQVVLLNEPLSGSNSIATKQFVRQQALVLTESFQTLIDNFKKRHTEIVKLLFETTRQSDVLNSEALVKILLKGDQETVQLLLDQNLDLKTKISRIFVNAAGQGNIDLLNILLEAKVDPNIEDSQALINAAQRGHTKTVELLLNNGANPNAQYSQALTEASWNNHFETIELLRQAGSETLLESRIRKFLSFFHQDESEEL